MKYSINCIFIFLICICYGKNQEIKIDKNNDVQCTNEKPFMKGIINGTVSCFGLDQIKEQLEEKEDMKWEWKKFSPLCYKGKIKTITMTGPHGTRSTVFAQCPPSTYLVAGGCFVSDITDGHGISQNYGNFKSNGWNCSMTDLTNFNITSKNMIIAQANCCQKSYHHHIHDDDG